MWAKEEWEILREAPRARKKNLKFRGTRRYQNYYPATKSSRLGLWLLNSLITPNRFVPIFADLPNAPGNDLFPLEVFSCPILT